MRFLYIHAGNSVLDLPMSLEGMGHEVDCFDEVRFFPDDTPDEAYEKLDKRIREGRYDFLISYLFFDRISRICQDRGLRYISWVYDSPLVPLFDKEAENEVNHIFVFDKNEYERLKAQFDIPHLYYMPMASCTQRIGRVSITQADQEKFSHDISFVGDLYEDNAYDLVLPHLPEEMADRLKAKLTAVLCKWDKVRPWPRLDDDMVSLFREKKLLNDKRAHSLDVNTFIGVAIESRKLAQLERATVLNALATMNSVDLYTRGEPSYLQGVTIHPGVDYYTDMTKVFNLSRINLNITIPSIETGIPQRVWDIIGSGGFCLTNYQEEIEEYFVIGQDIETFKSIDELLVKADYYLKHEDVRMQILCNGYEKVTARHTYEHRIERMMELVLMKS